MLAMHHLEKGGGLCHFSLGLHDKIHCLSMPSWMTRINRQPSSTGQHGWSVPSKPSQITFGKINCLSFYVRKDEESTARLVAL